MNDRIMTVLQSKWAIPATVGVVSFASGLGAGYIWGKRNGDVFEVTLDSPVEEEQLDLFNGWEQIVEEIKAISKDHLVEPEVEDVTDEEEEEDVQTIDVYNVFAQSDDSWDYEAELSLRSADEPYVIHVDEFLADEMDYTQVTVTYYAGDDIMTDEADVPIYNYSEMMGALKWGHGSKDSGVVYIRNEVLKREWEVLLHQGLYSVEVLGHTIEQGYEEQELKHSVQKFRRE